MTNRVAVLIVAAGIVVAPAAAFIYAITQASDGTQGAAASRMGIPWLAGVAFGLVFLVVVALTRGFSPPGKDEADRIRRLRGIMVGALLVIVVPASLILPSLFSTDPRPVIFMFGMGFAFPLLPVVVYQTWVWDPNGPRG